MWVSAHVLVCSAAFALATFASFTFWGLWPSSSPERNKSALSWLWEGRDLFSSLWEPASKLQTIISAGEGNYHPPGIQHKQEAKRAPASNLHSKGSKYKLVNDSAAIITIETHWNKKWKQWAANKQLHYITQKSHFFSAVFFFSTNRWTWALNYYKENFLICTGRVCVCF